MSTNNDAAKSLGETRRACTDKQRAESHRQLMHKQSRAFADRFGGIEGTLQPGGDSKGTPKAAKVGFDADKFFDREKVRMREEKEKEEKGF